MKNLGLNSLALFILLIANTSVSAQTSEQAKSIKTIRGFLSSLYQTNLSNLAIANKYILLQEGPNDLSIDERYQLAAKHIEQLRHDDKSLYTSLSVNSSITPYIASKNDSLLQGALSKEQEKLLYIVKEANKPTQYFVVKNDKIISFYFFQKGNNLPGYFLSY